MTWLDRARTRPTAAGVAGTGQARTTPNPSRVSNAVAHLVIDYGVDQAGYDQTRATISEATSRLRGSGGGVYAGQPGNDGEGRTFYGLAPSPQMFAGAAALAANPVTYRETLPMIDNGSAEGPYSDPARRIFAQRLARRKP